MLDCFPATGEHPVRVDCFDIEIESIREFSVFTQRPGDLVEVDQAAALQRERTRPQRGVGELLREGDRRGHHHRGLPRLGVEQGVEGGDAKAHQVRRRREVGLVGHPAARVEEDRPRGQPRREVFGQLLGLPGVAGHHQPGALRLGAQDGGDRIGAHRRGDEGPPAFDDELRPGRILREAPEE
ncbi:MAG: hypothetical protein ACKOK7_03870 [Solirubrobacterales bacterium]